MPGNAFVGIALGGHVHQLAVDVCAGDLTHAKLAKPADGNFHFVAVAPAGPVFDGRLFFCPERLCYLAERIALFSADGCLNNRGINFGLNLSECATIEVAFFAVDNTAALHQAVRALCYTWHCTTTSIQIHFDKPARRWYNTIAGSFVPPLGKLIYLTLSVLAHRGRFFYFSIRDFVIFHKAGQLSSFFFHWLRRPSMCSNKSSFISAHMGSRMKSMPSRRASFAAGTKSLSPAIRMI